MQVRITPETLPRVPKIRHLAASPDGATLALVVDVLEGARFRNALWHAPTDGSAPPHEVDLGGLEVSQPAYLADGSLLFCSSPPDASAEPTARSVYFLPADGGAPRRLLTVPGGISAMEVRPAVGCSSGRGCSRGRPTWPRTRRSEPLEPARQQMRCSSRNSRRTTGAGCSARACLASFASTWSSLTARAT